MEAIPNPSPFGGTITRLPLASLTIIHAMQLDLCIRLLDLA